MPRKPPPNKHCWTSEELSFLKMNFHQLTNRELAVSLKLTLTLVRTKCYELGLKRMEMEYWTQVQVKYLVKHYQTIGDKELAEIFNKKWPKQKGWSHKHIEKKRRYLHLKRTQKQVDVIRQRNIVSGRFAMCPVKAWDKRGRTPVGTIKYWRRKDSDKRYPVIKTKCGFVHWCRWKWNRHRGSIPKGMNVVFKDGDPYNLTLRNLELISDAELSKRNSKFSSQGLSDNYIAGILSHNDPEIRPLLKDTPKLLEAKRQQLLLQRTIKSNEQIIGNKR